MDETIEDKARQAALADWQNESVRCLVLGTLRTDRPLLDLKPGSSPFYVASVGCVVTDDNQRFCTSYNETINKQLQQNGVPRWSAAARCPDRQTALAMLTDGRTLDTLTLGHAPYEHRLFESLLGRWEGTKPKVWFRDTEKELLILAGDWSPKVGRVEILDVKEKRWMACYEYLRKHVPRLPWDED
jgi:hypothetical protein